MVERRIRGRSLRPCAVALAAAVAVTATSCGGDGNGASAEPAEIGPSSPELGRNVVRVSGKAASDVATAALLAVYSPDGEQPSGWVTFDAADWRAGANAAQFAGAPVGAGLLPIRPGYLPTAAEDVVGRLHPSGFPHGEGLDTLIIGRAEEGVIEEFESEDLALAQIPSPTPEAAAAELVPFRGGWAEGYSRSVVVVSSEAPDYALPAAAWSAFSGDTIAFATRERVPAATAELLEQRRALLGESPSIYVIGPPSVISDSVAAELSAYGEVKRVGGGSAADMAIALARYRDPATGFGWGIRSGPANLSFAAAGHLEDAAAAYTLAGVGPRAPLLVTGEGDLPGVLVAYLEQLRNAEGNQGYVLGDRESIEARQLPRIDALLEPTG